MDRNELKVMALLERIRDLTVKYENEQADLRVQVTLQSQEIERLQAIEEQYNLSQTDNYEEPGDSHVQDALDFNGTDSSD